jgi:hypothetical protein
MDKDRQLKAEEKERKKSDHEKKIACIAVLENKMAVEDVETREAPAPCPHPRPLHHTSSHVQIPLYTDASDEPVGAESEPFAPEWDEEGASDATEPADVTPKKRKTKVTVKEEIQAARKAMPASRQEEVRIKMTFVLELTFYNSQAMFVDGKDKATAHVKGTGTAPVPAVSI